MDDASIGLIAFSLIICITGLIGNIVAITTILILKDYKQSFTHWYVLQLAIADLIFLLTIPFDVTEDLYDSWIFPHWLCSAKETILFVNYYASVIFLMVMSVDRYLAVCHALSSKAIKIRKMNILITVIVWITAFLLSLPILIHSTPSGLEPHCKCKNGFPNDETDLFETCVSQARGHPDLLKLCETYEVNARCIRTNINSSSLATSDKDPNVIDYDGSGYYYDDNDGVDEPIDGPACNYRRQPTSWVVFLLFNFLVMFILPIVIMSVYYGLIIRRVFESHARVRQSESGAENRRRVTKICVTLVVTFMLCWLLFNAVHVSKIIGIKLPNRSCALLSDVSVAFAYLNSALNPFLYSCLGSNSTRKKKMLQESHVVRFMMRKKKKSSSKIIRESEKSNTTNHVNAVSNPKSQVTNTTGTHWRTSIDATTGEKH